MSQATVGAAIRDRRMRLGWDQGKLAQQVGVHSSRVSRWESDEDPVPAERLRLIARALRAPELLRWNPLVRDMAAATVDMATLLGRRHARAGARPIRGTMWIYADGTTEFVQDPGTAA